MAATTMRGHVVLQFNIHRNGRITDVAVVQPSASTRSTTPPTTRSSASNPDGAAAARVSGRTRRSSRHVLLQRTAAEVGRSRGMPTRTQQLGLLILFAALVVYVFVRVGSWTVRAARARGARADRLRQERARPGAGRALRRRDHQLRFDRRLSRLRHRHRQGRRRRRGAAFRTTSSTSPSPTEVYTAAQFARDAARGIREIHARGRLPILVGGTGFYYRALTRGCFPGPGATSRCARGSIASPTGVASTPAPHAAARRSGLGGAHHAARPQAPGPRPGGLLLDRPAADGALRRDAAR